MISYLSLRKRSCKVCNENLTKKGANVSGDQNMELFPVRKTDVTNVKAFFLAPHMSADSGKENVKTDRQHFGVKIAGVALVEMLNSDGVVVEIATGNLSISLADLQTEESLNVDKEGLTVTQMIRNVIEGEMKASEVSFADILLAAEELGKTTILLTPNGEIVNIEAEIDQLLMFFAQDSDV